MRKLLLLSLAALALMIQPVAAQCKPDKPILFPFKQDGKWGFINIEGRPIISPRYEDVSHWDGFQEEYIGVKQNGKWGFMDNTGKLAIKPSFDEAASFCGGYAAVRQRFTGTDNKFDYGRVGYIDPKGKEVISMQYQTVLLAEDWFSEGLCLLYQDNKFGYANPKGKMSIPFRFSWATAFSGGLAAAKEADGPYGYIDTRGKWAITPQYKWAGRFQGKLAPVRFGEKYAFIDRKGKQVTDTAYTIDPYFGAYSEKMWLVSKNDTFGYLNEAGQVTVPLVYEGARLYSEGMAAVSKGGKVQGKGIYRKVTGNWGFINASGTLVIEHKFEDVGSFSEGLAPARENGKWGYINPKGAWAIPPTFDEMPGAFNGGLAPVKIRISSPSGTTEKLGWINKTGAYKWEPSN